MSDKAIVKTLNQMCRQGFLKKVKTSNGEDAWRDSDFVTKLLNKGKSRSEISEILRKRGKQE